MWDLKDIEEGLLWIGIGNWFQRDAAYMEKDFFKNLLLIISISRAGTTHDLERRERLREKEKY